MSRILTISDDLYMQLDIIRRERGLTDIKELLEQSIQDWAAKPDDLHQREKVVQNIDTLRERLFSEYGEQADSVDLIRADRDR